LSYRAHRDLDNPAYPVLAWSLYGLNSSQKTPVETAGFWRVIGSVAFETQRIDPNASLFNGTMLPIIRITQFSWERRSSGVLSFRSATLPTSWPISSNRPPTRAPLADCQV
jgi:hypothetical protein